jgi:hypothetical protein
MSSRVPERIVSAANGVTREMFGSLFLMIKALNDSDFPIK